MQGTSGYDVPDGKANATLIEEVKPVPEIVSGIVPSRLHSAVLGYAVTRHPDTEVTRAPDNALGNNEEVMLIVPTANCPVLARAVTSERPDCRFGVQFENGTTAPGIELIVDVKGHWEPARKVALMKTLAVGLDDGAGVDNDDDEGTNRETVAAVEEVVVILVSNRAQAPATVKLVA